MDAVGFVTRGINVVDKPRVRNETGHLDNPCMHCVPSGNGAPRSALESGMGMAE